MADDVLNRVGDARVPTFVTSLDKVIGGGLVLGSTVLVLSELGAGGKEFLQTSMVNYYQAMIGRYEHDKSIIPPERVYYVSQKHSTEVFYKQLAMQFDYMDYSDFTEKVFQQYVKHIDLGERFFARTTVPHTWYTHKSVADYFMHVPESDEYAGFASLASLVDITPPNSLVLLDSITPYLPYYADETDWKNFVSLMYGLSRAAKEKGTTYVILMTQGILPRNREIEVSGALDAVFRLQWQKSDVAMTRQRQMYIEKYDGVLPTLSARDIATYNVTISPGLGFEISNLRRVT
ncbi:MAG: hypothetical protein Q4Q53_00780 [Methanocorpusculum sp.]|nr:hypothetical protein [Methanocorpusculum sp.]